MGGGMMRTMAKAAASVDYRTGRTPLAARAWEDDDGWDQLAGGREEALLGTLHPSPPSLEEAHEAASDLKAALSGPCSPHANGRVGRPAVFESSWPGSSESAGSCLEYHPDAKKGCAGVLTSSPTHVVQSFSLPPSAPMSRHVAKALALMQECPDVQNIVASLAADHTIWDVVMKNENVVKYCAANRINICTECTLESVNQSDQRDLSSPVDDCSPQSSEVGFIEFMQSLRLKVREMVSNLSELFESFVIRPSGGHGSTSTTTILSTDACNRNSEDMAAGASFVALTIATIILIILKRGDK